MIDNNAVQHTSSVDDSCLPSARIPQLGVGSRPDIIAPKLTLNHGC